MAKAKFGSLLLLVQAILLILFVVFVDYGEDFLPENKVKSIGSKSTVTKRAVFQDVHVMVFFGFGLITTFLKRYSRGMLAHTFLIGGLVIQWATLLQGFFSMKNAKIDLSFDRMFNADYSVIAILISFGAVIGKCNSLQFLVMALLQTFFFAVNEAIVIKFLGVSDNGRSIVVHVFSTYFGLAVSRMIYSRKVCMSQALSTSNKSEMYSFIGALFLWVYWPTMNSAFSDGPAQNRAVANTYYALAASCIATYAITVLQSKQGKFNMLHLQNASIAGGVAVGAVASMMLRPWGAIILGIVGALSSIMGYKYLVPVLRRKLKIHDTRGIHAAHGLPGIISGVASIVAAILANENTYGTNLYELYPERAPQANTTKFIELQKISYFPEGADRTALWQGIYQLVGLVISMLFAVVSGMLTGFIISINFFEPVKVNDAFDDHIDFEEGNCIDMSSEPEFEDDDERHHDSLHGNTRLLDRHNSDIVASDNDHLVSIKHYDSRNDSIAHSIDKRSGHDDEDYQKLVPEVKVDLHEDDVELSPRKGSPVVQPLIHVDSEAYVGNEIEMKDTSTQPLIEKSEHETTEAM